MKCRNFLCGIRKNCQSIFYKKCEERKSYNRTDKAHKKIPDNFHGATRGDLMEMLSGIKSRWEKEKKK